MIKPTLFSLVLALLPGLGTAQAPDNCEPLRAQIEANIAAKGVTGFAVSVVAADAAVTGEVVGTCGNGTRKIVYAKGAAPAQAAAPARAQPQAVQPAKPARPATLQRSVQDDDILTECRDGSVVRGRNCKN